MNARGLRLLSFGLLLLATGWCVLAARWGPVTVLAGLLLGASAHALVLAAEFVLMHAVNRHDAAPRAGYRQLLRAWWTEVRTAGRVFLWDQPWRCGRWPDRLPDRVAGAPPRRGVVLVHGFLCNRGLWNPWLQRLTRAGRAFVAVDLEPVFGGIDGYVAQVDRAVHAVARSTGCPPLVVCHSMGGLAVRAWLRHAGAEARIAGVVTLGTPHRGTWLSRWAVPRNARQMRTDSRWIAGLAAAERAGLGARVTSVWSHCDNIVFPASCAVLPGARSVHLPACGHLTLARHPAAWRLVSACLHADERPAQ